MRVDVHPPKVRPVAKPNVQRMNSIIWRAGGGWEETGMVNLLSAQSGTKKEAGLSHKPSKHSHRNQRQHYATTTKAHRNSG